jgi:hypothetical protein
MIWFSWVEDGVVRVCQLDPGVERSEADLPFLQRFVLESRQRVGIDDLKHHEKGAVEP